MANKILILSALLTLTACAEYELADGRIVPVFDEPSYQTDIYTRITFSDRDEVYTEAGQCQIRAAKPADHESIGRSLWQCTQGISTGPAFTAQELANSEQYHVVVDYVRGPLVIEREIGPCDMDVGLFEANNCTPFGSMNPIAYDGLVLITGNYVEIFAERPVDGNDWSRLSTLGHEFCHGACPGSIGDEKPVKLFTNAMIGR